MSSVVNPVPAAHAYSVALAAPAVRDVRDDVRAWWNSCAPHAGTDETDVGRSPANEAAWRSVYAGVLGGAQSEILDVGCGTGDVAMLLHAMGHLVRGVDFATSQVRAALARARACGARHLVEFCLGDAEHLPYPDASFDVVHVRHVLWTLPDPHRAAAEWVRVLRPGGRVVVVETSRGGAYDGASDRVRRTLGGVWRGVFGGRRRDAAPSHRPYPGRAHFPFHGGARGAEVARFLADAGLRAPRTIDVGGLRRAARAALPWRERMLVRTVREDSVTVAAKAPAQDAADR